MMKTESTIQILNYTETPRDKEEGIVSVRFTGTLLLRYKVFRNSKSGFLFAKPPILRFTKEDGGPHYMECFVIDSKIESEVIKEEIEYALKHNKFEDTGMDDKKK